MNSEIDHLSLGHEGSGGLKCSLRVPHAWTLTRATAQRVVLMPDDLGSFAGDGFAPNIVVTGEGTSADDVVESGPPTILGLRPGSDTNGSMCRSVAIDSLEDRLLFQLVGTLGTEPNQVTAVCTALDTQWHAVSEAFDTVIDALMISETEEAGNNEN